MKKQAKLDLLRIKLHLWDRIVLFCIPVLFLIITATMVFLVKNFVNSKLEAVNNNLKDSSYTVSMQMNDFIKAKANELDMMATFPDVYTMDKDRQKRFVESHCNDLGFRTVFFVDNDGFGYYPLENKVRNQSGEEFFRDISTHDFFVTEPYYPHGDPFTTICRPIYDTGHNRIGTICGTIYLRSVQVMMVKYENISKGTCYIIKPNGLIMVSSKSDIVRKQTNLFEKPDSDFSVLKDVVKNHKSSFGLSKDNNEKYYTYGYYMADYNWILVVNMPAKTMFNSIVKTMIIFAIFAVSFILVFANLVHIINSWSRSNNKIYTDPLCQCGSRAACNAMLEELDKHYDKKISVIFADLNKFKLVNDRFGHKAGDEMLKVFARHLIFIFGDFGFVGRNGGDEFIIFLYDIDDDEVKSLLKELEERLSQASARLAYDYEISSSFGFDVRPAGSREKLVDVLKRADAKMYMDKEERKRNAINR